MRITWLVLGIASLVLVLGCHADTPIGVESPSETGFGTPTPMPPSQVELIVENISLRYTPFSYRSEINAYVRNKNSLEGRIDNYEVHYSFDGDDFPSILARLINPTNIEIVSNSRFGGASTVFVVGSQAVVDAKGINDRVYVKIVLSGKDSADRPISRDFITTWSI